MPDGLVRSLIGETERLLTSLIARGSRCALLNAPTHTNPGDHAIWLGTKALLRRLGVSVVYECDTGTYDPESLLALADADTKVLLHGGGNLGDLYPMQQELRERQLAELTDLPIIQLPQSIHFQDATNLVRIQRLVEAHGDVTILVRDRQSLDIARASFQAPVLLCPDAAFAVDLPRRHAKPDCDVLWLRRTDEEARTSNMSDPPSGVVVTDWMGDRNAVRTRLVARLSKGNLDRKARFHVARGLRILERGRVVVTDRLHGHILCVVAGIPHVVLDNSYGKTRGVYEAWTSTSPVAHWADSPEEALASALGLLETEP